MDFNLNGFLEGLAGVGSIAGVVETADEVGKTGSDLNSYLQGLGTQLQSDTDFRGYGVRTGVGNSAVSSDGSLNLGVGRDQFLKNLSEGNLSLSGTTLEDLLSENSRAQREQEIYDRNMALVNPTLDRAEAATNVAEYATGRRGVMGSQFGGSGEDAAMARARVEGANSAAFNAMSQAEAERAGLAGLADQLSRIGLGAGAASYDPMKLQLEALQTAGADADRAQTADLTAASYLSQLGLGGAEVEVNADNVRAQLLGNLYDSLLDNIGGTTNPDGSTTEGLIGTILNSIGL